ncbi:myb-related protein 308-like protein [Salvia divinorum]|uniref:Myb-related protein 308-like protein n=1 Tax=Salvia divinorum TaxID=28513 RepID=A0ABD1G4T7_SALDI
MDGVCRWSVIASYLPGRTDNEIKNHWNSHLSRTIYRYRFVNEATLSPEDMIKIAKSKGRHKNAAAPAEQPSSSSATTVPSSGAKGWPDALMLSPINDATQGIGVPEPFTEIDDDMLMHLNHFLQDDETNLCRNDGDRLTNTDKRDGDWSSDLDMYGCLSPIVSCFDDVDMMQWDHSGAGGDLNLGDSFDLGIDSNNRNAWL